ncbi:hypothetical protein M3P36_04925 [Altererythrobacter sp. KTW20L]|uniref:hypothetical protein n=1 Tax=Altererythrobacter sp. KTW20L TaxID=2942210 RepID=UPI0020BF3D37|nr:hypothetical protein [Altererythrobacter sp. KTW20L]MCL6250392.1 hypothetical protein [Altererythrobacter sp. KTW20L]
MKKEKGRKRERITSAREKDIIQIIRDWNAETHKLTAVALERAVASQLGFTVSRQGMMKRDHIKTAFDARVLEIGLGQAKPKTKEPLEDMFERRIKALKEEVAEKDRAIEGFKETFVRYRYNAMRMGFKREALEAPIPPRPTSEGSRG